MKALSKGPPNVLTIMENARLLGLSEVTLRPWDKSGKFSPHRHPVNVYRCHRRNDVLRLPRRIEMDKAA